VGKMLAMAYVRTTHAWPGARLIVMSNGRPIPATVAQTPFFDAAGARIRAKASDGPDRIASAGSAPSAGAATGTLPRPALRKGKGAGGE
jgi:hypothetical protein